MFKMGHDLWKVHSCVCKKKVSLLYTCVLNFNLSRTLTLDGYQAFDKHQQWFIAQIGLTFHNNYWNSGFI